MKVAIIGSRDLEIHIPEECIPENTSLIISGGAKGVDKSARDFAYEHHIKIVEILPEYDLYGKRAPLKRNDVIIAHSDMVVAFWNGKSHGTGYVVNQCRRLCKKVVVYLVNDDGDIQKLPEQITFEL